VELSEAHALALAQRILDREYADDDEAAEWMDALGRAYGCPTGYVSDLIFWPLDGREVSTAAELVERAAACRPIAL
jgi:hypothetical protein